MKRPFLISGVIGIGVILVSIVMLLLRPPETGALPPGFFTAIIAFEFAESTQEVETLFLTPVSPARAAAVQAVRGGTWLDFFYMLLYSGFLASFAVTAVRQSGQRLFYLAAAFAGAALVTDALENIVLLTIMDNLGGDFVAALGWLKLWTWLKWGSLALAFVALIPYFARGDMFARFIAMFGAVPFVLGVLAYFNRGVLNELFSLAIAVQFLLLIVYCWVYRVPQDTAATF